MYLDHQVFLGLMVPLARKERQDPLDLLVGLLWLPNLITLYLYLWLRNSKSRHAETYQMELKMLLGRFPKKSVS